MTHSVQHVLAVTQTNRSEIFQPPFLRNYLKGRNATIIFSKGKEKKKGNLAGGILFEYFFVYFYLFDFVYFDFCFFFLVSDVTFYLQFKDSLHSGKKFIIINYNFYNKVKADEE